MLQPVESIAAFGDENVKLVPVAEAEYDAILVYPAAEHRERMQVVGPVKSRLAVGGNVKFRGPVRLQSQYS